jgi:hypothetical protein
MKIPTSKFILKKIIRLQIKLLSTEQSQKKRANLEGFQELVAEESPVRK